MKQTFELQARDGVAIGYVSKDNNDRLCVTLSGFIGKLTAMEPETLSERLYTNVDDFVAEFDVGHRVAIVDCDRNLTLVIGAKSTISGISVEIFHPVAGRVFADEFCGVVNVTGKTAIS